MILHTHTNADGPDTYVAHLNREETEELLAGLTATLLDNPDSDSFSISLGHVHPDPVIEIDESAELIAGEDDSE